MLTYSLQFSIYTSSYFLKITISYIFYPYKIITITNQHQILNQQASNILNQQASNILNQQASNILNQQASNILNQQASNTQLVINSQASNTQFASIQQLISKHPIVNSEGYNGKQILFLNGKIKKYKQNLMIESYRIPDKKEIPPNIEIIINHHLPEPGFLTSSFKLILKHLQLLTPTNPSLSIPAFQDDPSHASILLLLTLSLLSAFAQLSPSQFSCSLSSYSLTLNTLCLFRYIKTQSLNSKVTFSSTLGVQVC